MKTITSKRCMPWFTWWHHPKQEGSLSIHMVVDPYVSMYCALRVLVIMHPSIWGMGFDVPSTWLAFSMVLFYRGPSHLEVGRFCIMSFCLYRL